MQGQNYASSNYSTVVLLSLSISSLFLLLRSNTKRRISTKKLNLINEALNHADQRLISLQKRHDALLSQVCTQGLFCNRELHAALLEARRSMAEASQFADALRKLQIAVVASFPDLPHGSSISEFFRRDVHAVGKEGSRP